MPWPELRIAIPVKPAEQGKSRLGAALDPEERASLAESLFRRALAAALQVAESRQVMVVTAGAEFAALAAEHQVPVLHERHPTGVNAAVGCAVACCPPGAPLLVLHGDLPAVTGDDLNALIHASRALGRGSVVLAPDRHGVGTNALLLWPAGIIEPRFEGASAAAHRQAALARQLPFATVRRPGLATDVDTPADLAALH